MKREEGAKGRQNQKEKDGEGRKEEKEVKKVWWLNQGEDIENKKR